MKLSQLKRGEKAKIKAMDLSESIMRRLISLGLCTENVVEFERSAPLGDPQQYYVAGNFIAIRKKDAERIEVECL